MATFTINPSNSVLTTAAGTPAFDDDSAGSDKLTIADGAFLIATGAGSSAVELANTGAWNVTVRGSVVSQLSFGIHLTAGAPGISVIDVFDDGAIGGDTAILIDTGTAADVINSGTITGIDVGIATDGDARRIITNLAAGLISGTNFAIQDLSGLSTDEVTNRGTIEGVIDLSGGNDKLTNFGTVTGDILLGDGTNTMSNSGRITGKVTGGTGNDSITNSNTITGNVDLGDGTNKVTNRGTIDGDITGGANGDLVDNFGTITGIVNLGDGNDTFLGSGKTDTVQDGDGADSVKMFGGNDAYVATGNSGTDGNDTIDGGVGTDTYDASAATAAVFINLDTVSHDRSPYAAAGTDQVAAKTATGADVAGAGAVKDTISNFENAEGGTVTDVIYGSAAANVLNGNDGDDFLFGFGGNDTLDGGAGVDNIAGGTGKDTLTGGTEADVFLYAAKTESGVSKATRDLIADFEDNTDSIDLTNIDAKSTVAGNDAFTFLGTNVVFNGVAGELRAYWTAGGQILEGDINGDAKADFAIELFDPTHLIVLDAGIDLLV